MSKLKCKHIAYDASFKLNVVQFIYTCDNNYRTSTEFGISEKPVQDWCKFANKLSEKLHKRK